MASAIKTRFSQTKKEEAHGLMRTRKKILLLDANAAKQSHGGDDCTLGDVFIHQLIETIEFVLGCISNTASYLRLWALSLAHGQLSKVFYEHLIKDAILTGNTTMLFLTFPAWATANFAVLMVMDLMECALHTVRLHWVEF